MNQSKFIHFHVRSEYSFDCGFFNILDYVKFCYENGYHSAVITEKFNLYSAIKFYKTCLDFGIKPIIGCEFLIESHTNNYSKVILLCKNYIGYKNLLIILSKAYVFNSISKIPILKYKWLSDLSDGLFAIALSIDSDLAKLLVNNDFYAAHNCLNFWNSVFKDRYYISLTRLGIPGERIFFERILDFSINFKLNIIATNEVSFLMQSDILSYRSKIAMFEGSNAILFTDHHIDNKYFKNYSEMHLLFSNIDSALYNTVELAKRCNLVLKFGANYSPKFLSSGDISVDNFLFKDTFSKIILDHFFLSFFDFEIYVSRLKVELSVILKIGFANYFLVTHEFIFWARNNEIFVGPGRGSGAGSLVAYLLFITTVDPILNDLLFERFLNKDRVTSPDFDVDFCIEGRDLMMDFIFDFYGIKNVAQIVTFGCMTVKSVIREVGRILGYSYGFVDKITRCFSSSISSLKSELISNLALRFEYDSSFDIQIIVNLSLKIEGVIKGIGKHAGGLIISCINLLGYLPVQYEYEEFNFLTQLDKDDSESLGFTKFDFLGLKTLTLISDVVDTFLSYYSLKDNHLFYFDYFFFDDNVSFFLLGRGDTLGIFQFESYGLKGVLQKVKPDVFSDIISLIALYRPGPLQSGLLASFARRKTGEEKIDYIHSKLVPILRETYGILVYQEQVMLIAQIFSSYSLSDADFLRRAMGKKNIKDMETHMKDFIYGSMLNGVSYEISKEVFFLIEKFAGYGFNKAHSVGYGLLAYISCWLKSNYNIIFLSSLLSSDMNNNDDVDFYIDECNYFGIDIVHPDINRSFYCFSILNNNAMIFGFGFVKGLGQSLISEIIFIRSVYGYYNSFFDFLYRIDLTFLTKKVLQSLVYSGVFDKFNSSRFKLVLICNKFFDLYSSFSYIGINFFESLIDKFFNSIVKNFYYMIEYRNIEFFNYRFLVGGFLFTSPIAFYINDVHSISSISFKSGIYFNEFFCGVVSNIKIISKNYYNITIDGLYESKKIYVSSYIYKYKKNLLKLGKFVVACIFIKKNKFYELFIEDFYYFRYMFSNYLDIYFFDSFLSDDFFSKFFFIFSNKCIQGKTKVRFFYSSFGVYNSIFLENDFNISLHDDFLFEIKKFKEVNKINITYSF